MAVQEDKVSKSVIYALVRIFERKEHAESFLRGELRFGQISTYKSYVDKNGEHRGDPFEGVISWLQPSEVSVELDGLAILPQDISAPIALHSKAVLDKYALCLYAIHSGAMNTLTQETLGEFKRTLLIHEKSFGLGEYCVLIKNVCEFQRRVSSCMDGEFDGGMSRVNYFDESQHFARLPEEYDGMHKRASFSHQNEYRILVDSECNEDYLNFNIGDLSDIALLTTPNGFNQELEVSLPVAGRG